MDDVIEDGVGDAERLAQAPADLPDVHPNIANIYRAKLATFTEVLDDPDGGAAEAEAIPP